jgi:peptidyl-prolyl cis-trans isomerase SurA
MSNFAIRFRVFSLAAAALFPFAATAQLKASNLATPIRAAAGQESADYIVALVNSEPITYREVFTLALRAEERLKAQGTTPPSRQALMRENLERLINERIQIQSAKELGIQVSAADLDNAIAGIAAQNSMSVPQLMAQLRKENVNLEKFRTNIADELRIMRLRERDVEVRTTVSESEIDDHLRQQASTTASASDMEINLAQILIEIPDKADAATVSAQMQLAEGIRARLQNGDNFTKLAQEVSPTANKTSGAPMGLRNATRYPQLFVDAVASLQVGQVSAIVRSDAGFHILKLLEKKREGMPAAVIEQTQARHILIKTSPSTTEAKARQQLLDVLQRIRSKKDSFAALARQYSQDASADEGGDLGWVGPGQFVPEFENVMNQLPLNTVSEPVTSRFGVHLIEVTGRRNYTLSATEQREMVRNILRERKIQDAFPVWLQELRSSSYVEYRAAPEQ